MDVDLTDGLPMLTRRRSWPAVLDGPPGRGSPRLRAAEACARNRRGENVIAIWVALVFGVLGGMYALIDADYQPATMSASGFALAHSMSTYRDAVVRYALDHPEFEGSVTDAALRPLLAPQTIDPLWHNYVAPNADAPGSLVVIYATSAAATPAVTAIERLSRGSALAGVALDGRVVSRGNPAVPLPAALSRAVPDGMPVWMAQAW
ncbi:type IV pilus biogenesis protein PilM [Burkholderia ambifaria]|uniref:type IV pilus biogenesis protein PilM n=1 Tax=Burkholderia ambifaria TaxID=152480 RepID=UPI001FC80192|nr:type IV pilus biogenesis protein PilM [Burkholderia ambifaria]